MHFAKTIISSLVVALTTIVAAAPAPGGAALEERSGWTCNFLGAGACQVKCVGEGHSGGYCNSEQVCTCH